MTEKKTARTPLFTERPKEGETKDQFTARLIEKLQAGGAFGGQKEAEPEQK